PHLNNTYYIIHLPSFVFSDTPTADISTLSLHDALPICLPLCMSDKAPLIGQNRPIQCYYEFHIYSRTVVLSLCYARPASGLAGRDRKSTRLNSSHVKISYAVFCLKKKKQIYM